MFDVVKERPQPSNGHLKGFSPNAHKQQHNTSLLALTSVSVCVYACVCTCVCAQVFLQVSRRLEGFITHVFRTFVRFFSGVCPHVTLQTVTRGERFTAGGNLAPVRPVTRVRALVHLRSRHTSALNKPVPNRLTSRELWDVCVPSDDALWCSADRTRRERSGNFSQRPDELYWSSTLYPQTSAEHTHTHMSNTHSNTHMSNTQE